MRVRLAFLVAAMVAALCALATAQPLTPEQLCTASGNVRRAYGDGSTFVACLNGAVWETRSWETSPPGLRFSEREQACVPTIAPLVPRGPFQSAPDTPALPSIFLYVWSGVDNPSSRCKDAVIVVDFTPDSETFGRVVNVATTPFHGSEPHHVGLVANGSVLATGGIQSYLRGLPDIFLFNVSNARAPQYFKSVDPPLSAVTDSFIGQPDGGFFVTQMGDPFGGSPGRIARIGPGPEWNVVKEYPDNPPPDFNPHGFAIWRDKLVSADYLELKSTITSPYLPSQFRGSGLPKYGRSLRVWQLPDFTPISTFTTPPEDSNGFMTVQFVGQTGVAVSGNGKGVLWGLNVSDPDPASTAKPVHYIAGGGVTESCVAIPLAFSSGKRFAVTVLGLSLVQLVDTSDPWRWKVLQEIYLPKGTYPHALTAAKNGTLLAVSTYYIDHRYNGKVIGTIRDEGSREVYFFDVAPDGNSFDFSKRRPRADFKTEVGRFLGNNRCGSFRPHGMAVKSVTATPVPTTGWSFSIRTRGRDAVENGYRPALDVTPLSPLSTTYTSDFVAHFAGVLSLPGPAQPQFQLRASGPARVTIAGWPVQGLFIKGASTLFPQTRQARAWLKAGNSTVGVEFVNHRGASTLELLWRAPGATAWQQLPATPGKLPRGEWWRPLEASAQAGR